MTDRIEQLRKFSAGRIEPWLVDRIHAMDPEQWRRFYDQIEAGGKMPRTFEDTMPRYNGCISNPYGTPDRDRAEHLKAWEAWRSIWGEYPWEKKQNRRR